MLQFLPAAASALGGSGGIASGILQGISSIFGGRSKRKEEKRNREHELQLQREGITQTAEEARRSAAYQAMLEDFYSQRNRFRQSQGFQNYIQGQRSGALQGSRLPSLQRMVNFNSANRVADPGSAPPAPNAAVPDVNAGQGGGFGGGALMSPYANFVQR